MNRPIYCTIASANYLPRVFALRDSLRRYNQEVELRILLAERPEFVQKINQELNEKMYSPDEIGCQEWVRMAFHYNLMEFNTALKPFFLCKIFQDINSTDKRIIYVDPDVQFFSSPAVLEEYLNRYDILMTPHLTKPIFNGNFTVDERFILKYGQFNLGFLGVRETPNVLKILDWWKEKLINQCFYDPKNHLFTDQWWAQLFISFEDNCKIIRSGKYNVAWWNICQRSLTFDPNKRQYFTDDGPLVFFHFSNLSTEDPGRIAVTQQRKYYTKDSHEFRIVDDYIKEIQRYEKKINKEYHYSFSQFQNGRKITGLDRKIYYWMKEIIGIEVCNPFDLKEYHECVKKVFYDLPMDYRLGYILNHYFKGHKYLAMIRKLRRLF